MPIKEFSGVMNPFPMLSGECGNCLGLAEVVPPALPPFPN
jgi:hypothetical protein